MFHLYSISIHNVVTMSMQNRWTVCSNAHSDPFPPPRDSSWQAALCFFFLSSSRHSQLLWLQTSPGLSPMTAHLGPRRGGQTGRCPPCRKGAEGGAHVRGVYFVVKRGRGGRRLDGAGCGEMRQERRQRGLVRTFQLAGKEEGGGEEEEGEEGGARTHRALDFEFML